jgi:hypothetical protein
VRALRFGVTTLGPRNRRNDAVRQGRRCKIERFEGARCRFFAGYSAETLSTASRRPRGLTRPPRVVAAIHRPKTKS